MIIIESAAREELQESLTKRDLLEVVEELGIADIEISERYTNIVDAIISDCDENGVPEWGDCSKLLRRFLIISKITDKDGELITVESSTKSAEGSPDVETEYPECFGLSDIRDPACGGCKVYSICEQKHKESLPPCYGKSYSDTAQECELCIEKDSCKEIK